MGQRKSCMYGPKVTPFLLPSLQPARLVQEQVDELWVADLCSRGGKEGKCNMANLCRHQYRHVLKGKCGIAPCTHVMTCGLPNIAVDQSFGRQDTYWRRWRNNLDLEISKSQHSQHLGLRAMASLDVEKGLGREPNTWRSGHVQASQAASRRLSWTSSRSASQAPSHTARPPCPSKRQRWSTAPGPAPPPGHTRHERPLAVVVAAVAAAGAAMAGAVTDARLGGTQSGAGAGAAFSIRQRHLPPAAPLPPWVSLTMHTGHGCICCTRASVHDCGSKHTQLLQALRHCAVYCMCSDLDTD